MSATTAAVPARARVRRLGSIAMDSRGDLAVLTVLSVVAIAGFEPSFGAYNYLLAAVGGLVVGSGIALGCFLLRLSILPTTAAALGAYLLFGSPFAMPANTLFGVLPTPTSLAGLLQGAIFGWADIVTLQTPVEAPAYIAAVPYFATFAVSFVGVVLACRWMPRRPRTPRRSLVLLIAPTLLFLAGILLGTGEAYYANIRGVAFAAIALVWLAWRRRAVGAVAITVDPGVKRRKLIGVAVIVLGAIIVGTVGGTLFAPAASARFVLREQVTPPFDPLQYPSPLAGYRNFTKTLEKTDLFTVTGLSEGQKIRMATLDSYDGQVWSMASPTTQTSDSGGFELLGRHIPLPAIFSAGSTSRLTFAIEGYSDYWLPNAEFPSTLDFTRFTGIDPTTTVRVNTVTGTTAVTSGVKRGLSYTLGVSTPALPNDRDLQSVATADLHLPALTNVPDVVAAKALEYAGSAKTIIQQLRNIERSLKTVGYLSHGLASDPVPSRAGQGADRMAELFTKEPMVGDEEQYASAFALMARHLGYPTRVVMGFAPKVAEGQTVTTVTGADVTAWDEVAFEGVGWVPFYPTPTKTDAPKEQTTKPKLEPQPQVRQPPQTNQKQNDLLTPVKISDQNPDDEKKAAGIPAWAWLVGGVIGIPLFVYLIPWLIIAALKRARRRRRFGAATAHARTAGSWDELTDAYWELGLELPKKATRVQSAAAIEAQAALQGLVLIDGGLVPLAGRVDIAVFAGGDVSDDSVIQAWTAMDSVTKSSRTSAGWLRRRIMSFRYHRFAKSPVTQTPAAT